MTKTAHRRVSVPNAVQFAPQLCCTVCARTGEGADRAGVPGVCAAVKPRVHGWKWRAGHWSARWSGPRAGLAAHQVEGSLLVGVALDMVSSLAVKAAFVAEVELVGAAAVGHDGVRRSGRRWARHVTLVLGLRPAAVLLTYNTSQTPGASFKPGRRPALEAAGLAKRGSVGAHRIGVSDERRPAVHRLAQILRASPRATVAHETIATVVSCEDVALVAANHASVSLFFAFAQEPRIPHGRLNASRSFAAVAHAFLQGRVVELLGRALGHSHWVKGPG